MKTKFILLIVLFCHFSINAQNNIIDEFKKLTIINDSLQKQIKPLNDSLLKLNNKYLIELNTLNKQIKKLEKDLTKSNNELIDEISSNNKNKLKIERDRLIIDKDSLINHSARLLKLIDTTKKLFYQEKLALEKLAILEKENGKKEIQNQIISNYSKPIDDLIDLNTLGTIERDQAIIRNNVEAQLKIDLLKIYYKSENLLKHKFDKEAINAAISDLSKLEKTILVSSVLTRLSKYSEKNDALKLTIEKIIKIDNKEYANDEFTKNEKFKAILAEFASFYRNRQFEFDDYPYLATIIIEINKLKQKDPNSDIQSFRDRI